MHGVCLTCTYAIGDAENPRTAGTDKYHGQHPKNCTRLSHTDDWAPPTAVAIRATNAEDCPGTARTMTAPDTKDCPGITRTRAAPATNTNGTNKYLSGTEDCQGIASTSTARGNAQQVLTSTLPVYNTTVLHLTRCRVHREYTRVLLAPQYPPAVLHLNRC